MNNLDELADQMLIQLLQAYNEHHAAREKIYKDLRALSFIKRYSRETIERLVDEHCKDLSQNAKYSLVRGVRA
jgi:hypothetical protein